MSEFIKLLIITFQVSPYVAEFWNTVSNLMMIVMGLRGLYDVCTQSLETR